MIPKLPFQFFQKISNPPGHVVQSRHKKSYPFYIKATLVLLGMYLLFHSMMVLQEILVPICYAGLIAILLNPLVNRLNIWKVPRVLSISISLLLAILFFGGILFFLSSQLASFSELVPELKKRGGEILNDVQAWTSSTFNLSLEKQEAMISDALDSSKQYIGTTISTIMGLVGVFVLLPIYVFLLLYYKPMFINFFYEVFGYKHGNEVSEVLTETKSAIQSYIMGLLIETVLVAAMNSGALLLIGVKYAILLGVIGAILNLIPYIGGLVAIALPVAVSLVTGDSLNYTTPLIIIGAYMVIQFLDNNIIVPQVVSSKVEVNAFVSIIIVLMGGALWGVSGMFLSIPFVAILKIIFDRIEDLKPWGLLLGTTMNPDFSLKDIGTRGAEVKSVLNKEEEAIDPDEPGPDEKEEGTA